jgi:hypothetical protein
MAIGDSFNIEQSGCVADQYTALLVGCAYTNGTASTMNTKADTRAYNRFTCHTPANSVASTAGVNCNIQAVRPVKVAELSISAVHHKMRDCRTK